MKTTTSKILLIGEDIIRMEIKKPDYPYIPHIKASMVFNALTEMGWKINEEERRDNDSNLVTLENRSYPRPRIIIENAKNLVISSDSDLTSSTVIEMEKPITCFLLQNTIKCNEINEGFS